VESDNIQTGRSQKANNLSKMTEVEKISMENCLLAHYRNLRNQLRDKVKKNRRIEERNVGQRSKQHGQEVNAESPFNRQFQCSAPLQRRAFAERYWKQDGQRRATCIRECKREKQEKMEHP
jgi:broad specificity phosphatase PhoE